MADYKILQNIDLAQNEIKEVSKIANDRQDGKDKGLLIQTGSNTSLAFNRKIDASNTINSIKGTVKDGTKESTLNIEPSKVSISNTKGTTSSSSFVLGLDSKGNEHIEAVSPSIDIKTGDTDYTDPHISLKKDISTLGLQSNTVEIKSKVTTASSLKMNGGITGISNDIILEDSSENVSLNLKSDGTILESASKSITETVGTRSVLLNTEGIKIEDSTTSSTPSIIEVNDKGIKASKGSESSYVDIQSDLIEEQSKSVTIKTPSNVTLTLNETTDKTKSSASLTSTGTITLTSNKGTTKEEASTSYEKNTIVSKADTIKLQTQGYTGNDETKHYPHIELNSDESNKSILLEGNKINVYSKGTGDSVSIEGTTLNIENTNTSITSGDTVAISGTENITETSKNISLKDSSGNVSLNLNTNGTISESAETSITAKTVDNKVSLTLEKTDSQHSITLKNEKKTDNSKIEVLDSEVKISKGSNSSVDIQSNSIEEKSSNVTIKTPSENVTLTLNEDSTGSASLTSKGTITLTSLNGAKTEYNDNAITTEADTITIKAKGYNEANADTHYCPHIKLESNASTINSVLLEGKIINISSKNEGSNTEDTITLSGSKLNVKSATTEITSNAINIKDNVGNKEVLTLNTSTPSITIPSSTATDINSTTIGLGESGSTTTVSGSGFNVNTDNTNITSTTTVLGTTTIQSSSSSPANTIVVNGTSTSITGSKTDIKSTDVNIGTETTNNIIIGRKDTNTPTPTTTLQSSITNITSPTLNISSDTVNFTKTNQKIIFEGAGGSVTSKVPTVAEDTTVSVKKGTNDVFKVDTTSDNTSTTINGTTATINSTNINIGEKTTTAIKVGRNNADTTTLQSSITNITSPTINIGTDTSSSSVSIGKNSSTVSLKGRSNFSIEANDADSKVQANDLKFNTSLSSNDIKVYWDSTLNSLVFAKA